MSGWGQQGSRQGAPRGGFGARPQWPAPTQVPWGAANQQNWSQPNPGWQQSQQTWGTVSAPNRLQAPARRRGNPIVGVLKAMMLVMGVIFVGLVLLSLMSTPDGPGTEAPSQQYDTGGFQPDQYQNEQYQVPPIDTNPPELPMPETYGQASDWLVNNSIYNSEIAVPVMCEATPINLRGASVGELREHFNLMTGCLMRVFAPAVESAGYVAVRPSVTIYDTPVQTRCGTMPRQNAAYCAADQQVYYSTELPDIVPGQLRGVNYVVESVIAHEFAHAIQGRTGILISNAAWEQNSNESDANEFSRRLEVQADCWSGQFINSVGQSVGVDANGVEQLAMLFHSIGDDQLTGDPFIDGNHGLGENRRAWFLEGTATTSMGACNTFAAPDNQVR